MYCDQFHRGRCLEGLPVWSSRLGAIKTVRLGLYQSGTISVHLHAHAPPDVAPTDKPYIETVQECFPRVFTGRDESEQTKVVLCKPIESYQSPDNRVLVHISSCFGKTFDRNGTVEVLGGFKEFARYSGPGQVETGFVGEEVLGILYDNGKIRVRPTQDGPVAWYDLTCRNGSLEIAATVYRSEIDETEEVSKC